MGKKFAEMQRDRDMRVQEAARDTYEQFFADCLSIVLNDPDVMGKDVFGYKRIRKILVETAKVQAKLSPALSHDLAESDYCREEMDRCLMAFIPESEFTPFPDRYDHVKKLVPIGKEKK